MAQITDALHTAISHWQLDAATGAKDAAALRTTMRALAANIDGSHPGRISSQEKSRLKGKLELMAHVANRPGGTNAADGEPGQAHVSVFA